MEKSRIGIICALSVEAKNLISMLEQEKTETVSGIDFHLGTLYKKNVVIAVCGIGKVFAAVCAQTMVLKYNVIRMINTGVAGTLTDKLHIGHFALAESVVQHDMDTSALGDPLGMVSGINVIHFNTDHEAIQSIRAICEQNGFYCETGVIACGDRFVSDSETKNSIVNNFGAISCDMESGAMGQVCYINKLPFTVVRVISDEADGSACENYNTFIETSAQKGAVIVSQYIKNLI